MRISHVREGCRSDSKVESVDAAIARIASKQRGLISAKQLKVCGLDTARISRRLQRGLLHRVHRAVYAVGVPPTDVLTRRLAAVMALPAGSALGSVAAVDHIGGTRFSTNELAFETPIHSTLAIRHATVTRTSARAERHVRRVRGVPTTSLTWAATRLGTRFTRHQICNVINQGSWKRKLDVRELRRLLDRHPNVPGHGVVVAALAAYEVGSAGSKSYLEDNLIAMVEHVTDRPFMVNVHVAAGRSIEVDIWAPSLGLCLEADGPPHDEPAQQNEDQARDADLIAAGIQVERFHWFEMEHRPDRCIARLRLLFGTQ